MWLFALSDGYKLQWSSAFQSLPPVTVSVLASSLDQMELATFWWAMEINSGYVQNPPGKPDKGSFQE